MLRQRLFLAASYLTILSLLLAGCSPVVTPTSTPEKPAASAKAEGPPIKAAPGVAAPSVTPKPQGGQPRYGGILTYGQAAEPGSFDIHQEAGGQHPLYLMPAYNGLLQYDPLSWPNEKIIPDLADSWEMSPNGLEYKFRLRTGVKWHDGTPFSSHDVKATLDRVRRPPRGVRSPRQAALRAISEVEAISPDTVRISLNYPSASLSSILAIDWLAILPGRIIETGGDMKQVILGTGPFKFKGFVPGTVLEYVKNNEYFAKGRPYLEGIRLYLLRDDATRFAALRTGRVLYLPYPYGISPGQAKIAKTEPRLTVQINWQPTFYHLRLNLEKQPWSDPRVRRAASLAIDRQAFISTVFEGGAIIGAQMSSAGAWGIPENELLKMPGFRQPKDADVAEARKLLAEAGFPEGFRTSILSRPEETYQRRGTFILSELGKIGVKAELVMRVTAAFDDALVRGAFDTVVHGPATAIEDPDLRFGENYVTGAGRNYGKYSNPKFDELYQKQSREVDLVARKKLVREMLMILLEDNPDIALAWHLTHIAHASRVVNYKIASSGHINNKQQEVWLND
ncbi:MAG: ABC transporter substrate-binding protein [Chloroflexi bacterium]|nr:ABC transporter substrate-binding protein [Chloroflexota bacterium]